ncbi:chemotaxis protein [Shewanella sp. 1_MG-2023]|uniref:chemotaxis protein n=1 Tax=unclassified Shewanella TaxID=196818 RepID=UPI0026E27CAB|nr:MULTISPECIES: chemotaxis protein [unclassified Shewanella]MDO6613360.1 chemotaxis protein [Shewanella sp. 7_MG-2023]MDO6773168.1 chemotaxis protein [Shewanella sp. 2_MG-2023]MDO6795370.1 chemotaxis protein [Shewanella sp. 1_MG-2023]
MQIPSAMTSGIQGLQSGQNDLAQATTAVAAPEPTTTTPVKVEQDTVTLSSQAAQSTDKVSAIIDAEQAVTQAQASAEVIDVASENVGTIIDLSV